MDKHVRLTVYLFTSSQAQYLRKGRAFDNIMIERLWRTVKYEEVYLTEYENYFAAYDALEKYFEYYNNERRHSSLSKRTPSEVYFSKRGKNNDVA